MPPAVLGNPFPSLRVTTLQRKDLFAYLAIPALCLICALHIRPLVVDDGFIAHRYAANLLHGQGLVFTAGQRVEGISDVGWTLLMVIPQLLHWRPELFAMALGFACACAAFAVSYRMATRHFGVSHSVALGVVCGSILNAAFWLVALNGIESGLYALILTLSFSLILERRLGLAGCALGAAITLRPESIALAPLTVAGVGLFEFLKTRQWKTAWAAALQYRTLLFPWAAIALAIIGWRLSYYGAWLPNTVFAKSHPLHFLDLLRAVKYVLLFALEAMPWALFAIAGWSRRLNLYAFIALTWLAFQIAIVTASGGDWMPGHRFLNVFYPLIVLLAASGFEYVLNRGLRWRALVVAGSGAILLFTQSQSFAWTRARGLLQHHALADVLGTYYEPPFIQLATVLKPVLQPNDVLSPEVLGIFSYLLLDSPVHDWLGLADAHVAHHGTVFYPPYGKAEPAYSVDVVAPSLFAFSSGARNLTVFQEQTRGRFSAHYDSWQVVGQPLILSIRRDREEVFVKAIRGAPWAIVPLSIPR